MWSIEKALEELEFENKKWLFSDCNELDQKVFCVVKYANGGMK